MASTTKNLFLINSSSELSLFLWNSLAVQIRAAGALIKFLEKQRIGIELEDDKTKVPVLTVRLFML
jgi:hypothetical protein